MLNPYAIGKAIYLRAPTVEDVEGKWYQWFSDPDVTQFLGDRFWPNTKRDQLKFFESLNDTRERLVLNICLISTDEHIGVCNLSSINWVHRHADIALVIGEREYRHGALAIEVMTLLLDIAFNRLNLMNIKASHASAHPVTPLLLRLFGFVEIGRFTNLTYYRGEYVDCVLSQLSKITWNKRNKA
jgi:ribosomal-protein-alanine N-acetyltransferase